MAKVFGFVVMVGGLFLLCSGVYMYHTIITKKSNDSITISYLLMISGCIFKVLGIVLVIVDMYG